MKDIYINDEPLNICRNTDDSCKLVVDTGTSIITGPTEDLKLVLENININDCDDLSNLPTIKINIDGMMYPLNADEFILKSQNPLRKSILEKKRMLNSDFIDKISCKKAFIPLDVDSPRGPLWVLGDIFLRKYFVVFDRDEQRIGIALRRKY